VRANSAGLLARGGEAAHFAAGAREVMNLLSHRTRAVSSTLTDMLRGACYLFLVFGIIALGYAGFVYAGSHAYQSLEMKKFKQAGRLAEPHLLLEGDVIGDIEVPLACGGPSVILQNRRCPANGAMWPWLVTGTLFSGRSATFASATESDSKL
jgi:hypothetical protein